MEKTSGSIETACTVGTGNGAGGGGRGTNLKQILIHKSQYLIRGIYENRGKYFFH